MRRISPRTRDALVVAGALALLVLPAVGPYLAHGAVPRTNDLSPHLYRALALARVWSWSDPWPRWAPDLVHGFGYPVFNFFPALSHMAVVAVAAVGLPLLTAYRVVVALHFWLAAAGMFWFGRITLRPSPWRDLAAWAAAAAYVYAPYVLYDAHVRGSLPESQALALLPWLTLALWQAARGRRRWTAALPFIFAALFLSHYPVAFQTSLTVGLWLLGTTLPLGWRALRLPLAGLALGVLLTAFFWLPTLVEIRHTWADLSISQGYNIADNFLTWRELVDWPALPVDAALVNPPVTRPLPLVALGVAAVGLALAGRQRARRRQVALPAALLALCAWMMTPGSAWLWRAVPLLDKTLYPWRLHGVVSWLAAGLVLVSAESCLRARPRLAAVGLTALFIAAAAPWLFVAREPLPEAPGLADLAAFEAPPLFIGTTTLGEFLPATVQQLPDTTPLRDALVAAGQADRLVECAQARGGCAARDPLDAVYHLALPAATTVTYRQFAFPGWQATVDGAPVPIVPSQPDGLITVALPPGDHTLRVWWGTTVVRRAGTALSLAALAAGWPALLWWSGRAAADQRRRAGGPGAAVDGTALLAAGAAAVAVWLLVGAVETPLRRARVSPDGVLGVPAQTPLTYGDELALLGVALPDRVDSADSPIPVTTYWRPLRPIGVVYDFGVQIVAADGVVWSTPGADRPRDWRFIGNDPWPLDGYRMEPFVLHLLDGAPPGEYAVDMGAVRRDTGQTLAVQTIGRFTVAAPARGARPLEDGLLPLTPSVDAGGRRLLGARPDRQAARPGDPLRVGLLWQVTGPGDAAFTLRLVDSAGATAWQTDGTVAPGYPPTAWQPGDRLRSETVLRLPAALPGGVYRWQVAWADAPASTVAELTVTAPERSFADPALPIALDADFGPLRLLGAEWSADGLTLAWQATDLMATSYRVFVHLRDASGAIVAQSDGEPAGWSRPTTGWLPGEVVLDRHALPLPADRAGLSVVVGVVDPATGARLPTATGDDAAVVPLPAP